MAEEKRRHQRLSFEGTIFIELASPGLGRDHQGEVVICKTIDISRYGLKVGVNRKLTVGAILQVGVELSGEDSTLYLAGEVKWCEQGPADAGQWLVGFEILNANDSDVDTWCALLDEMGDSQTPTGPQ